MLVDALGPYYSAIMLLNVIVVASFVLLIVGALGAKPLASAVKNAFVSLASASGPAWDKETYRTGVGLARADASALADLLTRRKGVVPAMDKWVDTMAAEVVTTTEVLLPGMAEALNPGVAPERRPPAQS